MLDYEKSSKMMKALADPNRLKIVDMLSEGTRCACDLLEYFDFTQPALSHHMKILAAAEIVQVDKKGTWNHYSLNQNFVTEFKEVCQSLFSKNEEKETCYPSQIK